MRGWIYSFFIVFRFYRLEHFLDTLAALRADDVHLSLLWCRELAAVEVVDTFSLVYLAVVVHDARDGIHFTVVAVEYHQHEALCIGGNWGRVSLSSPFSPFPT